MEQICCFRGGKEARFIISAFSRYKVYKISDLTQSNRYSLTLITFEQRYLAWDQGPLWGKKAKTGVKWEKRRRAERYPREGFLIPRLPLGSLHSPFFFWPTPIFSPFTHNAEPGPRLSVIKTLWPY